VEPAPAAELGAGLAGACDTGRDSPEWAEHEPQQQARAASAFCFSLPALEGALEGPTFADGFLDGEGADGPPDHHADPAPPEGSWAEREPPQPATPLDDDATFADAFLEDLGANPT
jgi:hypothetical protein